MKEELVKLINGLSEDHFNLLVKNYVKEYYNTPNVRITNGPYDGGIDLEIFVNEKELRKNIQITVQKNGIEGKIESDLNKSRENVKKFDYQKKLDFYTSSTITKSKKNELKKKAETEFDIDLTIIDANTFAEDSSEYKSIRNTLFTIYEIDNSKDFVKVDKRSKILFDVLTSSKDTIEIKKGFIDSFIMSFIYQNPGSSLDDIFNTLSPNLNNKFDKKHFESVLNNLRLRRHLVSKEDKLKYFLSEEKAKEIDQIYQQTFEHEKNLEIELKSFLKNYGLENKANDLVELLKTLYQENYEVDINELKNTNNSFSASLKRIYSDIVKFFTKSGVEEKASASITKSLLSYCGDNVYLNKLAAGLMFTKLYNSDLLERYLNESKQTILIDTQILLRIVCLLYKSPEQIDEPAFKSVKQFLDTIRKYGDRVKLITTEDYVDEVVGHLQEAVKLTRFLNLPISARLGRSKNVFFNYYDLLKNQDLIEEGDSLIDFVNELTKEKNQSFESEDFIENTWKRIVDLLELIDIETINHEFYENFEKWMKEYESNLAYIRKERSYSARENDLRTILFLSIPKNHTDESVDPVVFNEPYLITWDSAFYSSRKILLGKNREFSYWYIYSPLKFADRLSVMNFSVNPKSINYNVISLAETNFNYTSKTTGFFDVISSLFNKKDISELSLISKLVELKERTQSISETPDIADIKDDDHSPVLDVLLELRNYYSSPVSKYRTNDLIKVFETADFEKTIIAIIEKVVDEFVKKKEINSDLFKDFDQLIEKSSR